MGFDGETYPFAYQAVQEKAPGVSGVYTLYTSQRWVFVGESDDIRQSLFRHLNEPRACMNGQGALSFSFEMAPASERVSRQRTLVAELRPACNSGED